MLEFKKGVQGTVLIIIDFSLTAPP